MDILKFSEFLMEKSGDLYDYGCVMIYPRVSNWKEITSMIDEDDIYHPEDPTYGIETNPHVTLLYGLHNTVTKEDIENVIDKFRNKTIDIQIDGIGKFDNDEYSVVKFNAVSPILFEINKELTKLPHTTDYPDYKPHMTISYVKKGKADKYLSHKWKKTFSDIDKIVYSMTNGEKIEFKL